MAPSLFQIRLRAPHTASDAQWAETFQALAGNRGACDEVWFSTGITFPPMAWHREHAARLARYAADLRRAGIEPEFADTDYLVLMLTPENPEEDYEKIKRALTDFCRAGGFRPGTPTSPLRLRPLPQALSVREAIFSPHEILPVSGCIGRVCGQPTVSCPPAIPIAVSGEIITEDVIPVFLACGVTELSVVKQTAGQN